MAVRTTAVDVAMPDVDGATIKTTEFDDLHSDEELGFNLVAVNAPELPALYDELGPAFFEDRYTIGVWAWETDLVPHGWNDAFRLVDEIWTYSRYVAEILGPVAPCPVVRVPLPIVDPPAEPAPLSLELPDAFKFLFTFDFFSTVQRKNPVGLVDAFKLAFAEGEGPQLILKSFNGDFKPERLAEIRDHADGRTDIHIVDVFLPEAERSALMAACDCYVSLHRSEGFGLTLGEAMAMGKPVVATGYSGNLDFMTPENSYLVSHGLTEVGPDGENYPAAGQWADPDLDHAARLLREVWEDQRGAAERGARAQRDVAEGFSLSAVGDIALDRLKRLHGLKRHASRLAVAGGAIPSGPQGTWVDTVNQKLSYDPLANAGAGPQGIARRAVLRGIRPYSYHQDELNEFIGRALGEIDGRITDLIVDSQSTARRLERRIAGLEGTVKRSGIEGMGRAELARMAEGVRARPAPTHPAIAHRDADGRWVLGFEGASQDPAGYRGFEDIFRGSEAEIAKRQEQYLRLFTDADWVLDIGCGRGEFLDLLRDSGQRGVGIDLDESMIARCKDKGHDAVLADAASYLQAREDGSVPAVFAAQVIEHLGPEELQTLLALLEAKLQPGGVAVLETVNPHSPAALKAFWTDTTHHHPLFPEVALALCRLAGFDAGSVMFPDGTGDFEADVYESRDYAVVARKASPAE